MAPPRGRAAVLVKPKTLEAREFEPPPIGHDDAPLRIAPRVTLPGERHVNA